MRKLLTLLGIGLMIFPIISNKIAPAEENNPPIEDNIPPNPECNIKGNVSYNRGKRWYHVPGMEDYENTKIDPLRGERWFCSEEEAINAGWERAPTAPTPTAPTTPTK